jgi:hypothetical protein
MLSAPEGCGPEFGPTAIRGRKKRDDILAHASRSRHGAVVGAEKNISLGRRKPDAVPRRPTSINQPLARRGCRKFIRPGPRWPPAFDGFPRGENAAVTRCPIFP